jgi:hypothetical protein
MPGSLYCNSNCSLVFGAHAGLTARANLAVIGDIPAQHFYLFVVDDHASIGAKLADTWV